MNLFTKTLLAGAMLVGSSASYAGSIYLDLTGTGKGNFVDGDGNVITDNKNQLGFNYQSNTTINLGGNGIINAGDTISTVGGIDTTSIATVLATMGDNHISGLIPSFDDEGFKSSPFGALVIPGALVNWGLSFAFNLTGQLDQVSGNTVQEVSYNNGLIEIFMITYNGSNGILAYDNIFDLTVTGSDNSNPSNFLVNGLVSYSGNENLAYKDVFRSNEASCLGSNSFYALTNCAPPLTVSVVLDQNLDDVAAQPGAPGSNTAKISGNHNGSMDFSVRKNIPEPSTLFLLGSSLFAFSATRRKKA